MKILSFLLLPLCTIAYSQQLLTNESPVESLRKAATFQQEEKYEEAIEQFSKISINDTNYALCQLEIGNCYIDLENYDEAKKVFQQLIDNKLDYDFEQKVFVGLGISYLYSGDSLKAVDVFTQGIEKFPMDYLLFYNRGNAYERLGEYQKAYYDFKHSIQRNIYFPLAHLRLGLIAANEEHYAEALLSLMAGSMIKPTGNYAAYIMEKMESIANGSFNPESHSVLLAESTQFDNINLLIKNKVALNKKYKTSFTFSTDYAKQFHFIMANAKYDSEDKNFWNQFYLPIFLEITKENKLDDLILTSLVMVESEDVQRTVKRNVGAINKFIEWMSPVYNKHTAIQYFDYEEENKKIAINYSNDGINFYGPHNESTKETGNFYYYHKNGALKLKATFNEGKPTGVCEFFSYVNNKMYKRVTYGEDQTNRIEEVFYKSGQLKERVTFKEDLIEDTVYVYYKNGTLKSKLAFKNNQRTGLSTSYYENGSLKTSEIYKEGKNEGPFKSFHQNGKPKTELNFINDLAEGKKVIYYPNGVVEANYMLKANLYDGPFETFYSNGKLEDKGTYKKGALIGKRDSYYSNGALYSTLELDDNGKENGKSIYYDLDGKKYQEIEFKSGNILEVSFFDKQGKMTVISDKKGKTVNYRSNYPSGKPNVVGKLHNGNRDGVWEYYDRIGNISKKETYSENVLIDTVYEFHRNGQIESKTPYKDGKENGIYTAYSPFGDLIKEAKYTDGNRSNEEYTYHPNGELENEYYWIDDELNGIQRSYSMNGKLNRTMEYEYGVEVRYLFFDTNEVVMNEVGEYNGEIKYYSPTKSYTNFITNYLNGEENGSTTTFGPNGEVLFKGNYLNGQRVGDWVWYYANGKKREECTYVNGRMEGINNEYYSDGKLLNSLNYQFGEGQGVYKGYFENGKIQLEGTYLDGKRHGKFSLYAPDGGLLSIRIYYLGEIESYSYLNEKGVEQPYVPFEPIADSIVTYHKNGKVALRSKRVNGWLEGEYTSYYENGQVYEKEFYKYNENDGSSKEFYENGTLKQECNYTKGLKNGIEKTYYPSGKIQSESPYYYGSKWGEKKEYSLEGKLITITTYYDDEIISINKR